MLRKDVIELFCNELPYRVSVVTNGTIPIQRFDKLSFYWISLDGTEKIHDQIRGEGTYAKTKHNILKCIECPSRNGKPAWKDIWITMTINSINYSTIEDLVIEWKGIINKIGFQFHTPFAENDPLRLQYGQVRNEIILKIINLKKNIQM